MLFKRFVIFIFIVFSNFFLALSQSNETFKKDSLLFEEYWSVGESHFYNNDIEKAMEYLEKAAEIAHRIELYDLWADCKMQMASMDSYKGDFISTFNILDSLETLIGKYPFDPATTSKIYHYQSIFLSEEGDHKASMKYSERSFLVKKESAVSALDKVVYYNSLGVSYSGLGMYDRALVNYGIALSNLTEAFEKGSVNNNEFNFRQCILHNITSEAYRLNQQFDKAVLYAEKAKANLEKVAYPYRALHQRTAQILAEAYMASDKPEKAKEHLYRRLQLINEDNRKNVREKVKAILAIAEFENKNDRPAVANSYYKKALIQMDSLQTTPRALFFAFSPLVKYYLDRDDLTKAAQLLDRSLGNVTLENVEDSFLDYAGDIELFAQLLSSKGLYFYKRYQNEKKTALLEESISWYRTTFTFLNKTSQSLGEGLNARFDTILEQINKDALNAIYEALQVFGGTSAYYSDVLSIIEFEKSFTENLNKQRIKAEVLAGLPPSLYEQEKKLKKRIRRLLLQMEKEGLKDSLTDEINLQVAKLDSLKEVIKKKYPVYNKYTYYPFTIDYDLIKKQVESRDLQLLNLYYADRYLYRLLITPDETVFTRVPAGKDFETAVNNHLEALKAYNTNTYLETANLLFTSIFSGLERYFDAKNMVIIPHKLLNFVPFESLVNKNGLLINSQPISYKSSLFKWSQSTSPDTQNNPDPLLMAPVFRKDANNKEKQRAGLAELTHSIYEVEAIGNLFGVAPFEYEAATKSNFIKNKDRSIIHLATHVLVNTESPLETRILFAAEQGGKESDLAVYEVLNMQLPSDMVVLSACETGVGPLKKGVGVQSLARSFAFSGAKSTVMSLWKVDDRSTGEIMRFFYRHLKNGEPKDLALQKAKRDYLDNTEEDLLKHPYYWAGFIVLGDTAPIVSSQNYYYWLITAIGLLLLLFLFRKKLFKFI
jgi:CHAT domain-containing protein